MTRSRVAVIASGLLCVAVLYIVLSWRTPARRSGPSLCSTTLTCPSSRGGPFVRVDADAGCELANDTSVLDVLNDCCSMLDAHCRLEFDEFVACKFGRGDRAGLWRRRIGELATRYLHSDASDDVVTPFCVEHDAVFDVAHAAIHWRSLLRGSVAFYLNTHYDRPVPFRDALDASELATLLRDTPPTFDAIGDAVLREYLSFAAPPPNGRRPRVVFIGGGGGAGKSSSTGQWVARGILPASQNVTGVVYINHDDLIARHPLFRRLAQLGSYAGANLLHAASERLGEQIYAAALRAGTNIVYEGTMASLALTQQKIALAQAAGYETAMIGLTVDAGIAIRRCLLRALSTKRYVPPRVLLTHHRDFSRNWPDYCNAVDACYLFQSSRSRVVQLIAESALSTLTRAIHLPAAYDAFAAKRDINVDASNVFELYNGKPSTSEQAPGLLWSYARPEAAASWGAVLQSLQIDARSALTRTGRCSPTTQAIPSYVRLKSMLATHLHATDVCFCTTTTTNQQL
jgi:predicted ABC-type ATPase